MNVAIKFTLGRLCLLLRFRGGVIPTTSLLAIACARVVSRRTAFASASSIALEFADLCYKSRELSPKVVGLLRGGIVLPSPDMQSFGFACRREDRWEFVSHPFGDLIESVELGIGVRIVERFQGSSYLMMSHHRFSKNPHLAILFDWEARSCADHEKAR